VFKLSKVLGGRDHVVDAPASEILKFMEMELEKEKRAAEKEREKYWMNYLVAMFAQAPMGEEKPERIQARKKFINAIKPQEQQQERKQFGWDHIPEDILQEMEQQRLIAEKGD
jgi:hypothetical protein